MGKSKKYSNKINGHTLRFSDSSIYDYVCTKCGGTDAPGSKVLEKKCKVKEQHNR